MANVSSSETSHQLMTPSGAPAKVIVISLVHDTRHICLKRIKLDKKAPRNREILVWKNPSKVQYSLTPQKPRSLCIWNESDRISETFPSYFILRFSYV